MTTQCDSKLKFPLQKLCDRNADVPSDSSNLTLFHHVYIKQSR